MSACSLLFRSLGLIICDKTPENLVALDLIDLQIVDLFIHLLRDPVSVYA